MPETTPVPPTPLPTATYLAKYLRPFAPWLTDPASTELSVNADGRVWIRAVGDHAMRPVPELHVAPGQARELAAAIVGHARGKLSKAAPLTSGKVEFEGRPMRAQVAVEPAVERGAAISIRLFGAGPPGGVVPSYLFGEPISLAARRREAMREVRALSEHDLPGALARAVRLRLNIVISGGTDTGKTTQAQHLLTRIDLAERLVTIEDAFELMPPQPNVVALLAERRPDSPRSAHALLEAALRLRPDRLVLGELRGPEALAYLEAINTGHGGSITTLHAETAELALDRLALLVMQAGTPLTFAEVRAHVARSIDIVVQLGQHEGRRGVTELFMPATDGEPARHPDGARPRRACPPPPAGPGGAGPRSEETPR